MELFISYAREDEAYRKELEKHLSVLLRQKVITAWHDRKIVAGQEWSREIDGRLESSSVIVLLVSPDFVHSEYCWNTEMARALDRHGRNKAVVIPVFIRPVYFEGARFAALQALPTNAKPVSTWNDQDAAWLDVVQGIRKTIDHFRPRGAAPTTPRQRPPALARGTGPGGPDRPPRPASGKMLDWLGTEGEQLRKAFIQVFGDRCRPFGNRALPRGGLSDGNEGVQWNAGYNPDTREAWVGVNLEGVQYRDWPVARLIQRELQTPTLPNVIRQLQNTDTVVVHWRRDYWQAASRPPIEEKDIAPTPIPAGHLTEDLWRKALEGAAGCLDPTKTWGGRATQEVTLSASKKRVTGPVSPHLTILVASQAPYDWELYFSRAKAQLQPFYDWAVEQARVDAGEGKREREALPFTDAWAALQTTLFVGATIQNWTARNGHIGEPFEIVAITPDVVVVVAPRARTPQTVRRADFEKVYALWDDYARGLIPRSAFTPLTRYSKYVISILHWLQEHSGAGSASA
jgi:hypothetical protein